MAMILEKNRTPSENVFCKGFVKQIVPLLVTRHLLAKSKTKIESAGKRVTSYRSYRGYPPELSDGRVCTFFIR